MNGCEVDNCLPCTIALRDGAAFLRRFMYLINSISDGWACWSYGTACSDDLQALLQTPRCHQAAVTQKQVDAAKAKVLRFLKRCKQTKDKEEVLAFIAQEVQ